MMGVYRSRIPKGEVLYLPSTLSITPGDSQAMTRLGGAVPRRLPARLVIDTGSRQSCLVPSLLDQLGSCTIGTVRVQTVFGRSIANLFRVRLEFPVGSLAPISSLKVVSLQMPSKLAGVFQGVIGRDILSQWAFCYSGFSGRLTIRDTPSIWSWLFG